MFLVYTKLHDDRDRLLAAFKKVTAVSSAVGFFIGILIFFLARPLILIFMGDQWIAAIPVIQVLSIYGILRTFFGSFSPLFLAVGHQDYVARMTFFRVLTVIITIFPLVSMYNMVGAGYAMLLSILVEIPVILYFTRKVFK
jgi:PST family polysaccharide transporter/lipopolysaccharide exporter